MAVVAACVGCSQRVPLSNMKPMISSDSSWSSSLPPDIAERSNSVFKEVGRLESEIRNHLDRNLINEAKSDLGKLNHYLATKNLHTPESRILEALVLLELGKTNEAAKLASNLLVDKSPRAQALSLIVNSNLEVVGPLIVNANRYLADANLVGGPLDAQDLPRRTLKDPGNALGWLCLAVAEYNADRKGTAERFTRRSLRIQPSAAGKYLLSTMLFRQNRLSEAKSSLTEKNSVASYALRSKLERLAWKVDQGLIVASVRMAKENPSPIGR